MKTCKRFLISLLILIVSVSLASATSTRDAGLGLSDVPWMADNLQSYIYSNPAYLGSFKNRAFFERDGFENGINLGGMIWNPWNGLTVAAISGVGVNSSVWNSNTLGSLFPDSAYEHNTSDGNYSQTMTAISTDVINLVDPDEAYRDSLKQQDIQVMAAYDFGKIAAGLSFVYASNWDDKTKNDGANNEQYNFSSVQYSIITGGKFTLNDTMTLDADVAYTLYDLQNVYNLDGDELSYKSDGAMDVVTSVGYNLIIGTKQKLHAKVSYGFLNRSAAGVDSGNSSTDTYSRMGHAIQVGISDELTLAKYLTVVAGLNLKYTMFTYEYGGNNSGALSTFNADYTSVQLPVYFAVELRPTKNFQARFGISHVIYDNTLGEGTQISHSTTADYSFNDNVNNSSSTDFHLGLGAQFYNIRIEWVLNIDIFTRGPEFLSGYGVSNASLGSSYSTPIATSFAVSYNFDSLWNKVTGDK